MRPGRGLTSCGVGVMALSLSACSALGIGGGGGNGGSAVATKPSPTPTFVSPLDEILAPIWGTNLSPDELAQRANAESQQRETLIAQCMHEAGFEYIPNPIISTPTPETNADTIWRPDDRDWVEEYGFAAIVSPWTDLGRPVDDMGDIPSVPRDPNQDYIDSLSETELQAFWDALWDPPIEVEIDADLTTQDRFALMGCWGWAQNEMNITRPSDLIAADEFAPLFEQLNEMYNSVYQQPEWTQIDRDWAECMADNGMPGLNSQNDAQQIVFDQLNAFWETWDWEHAPEAPSVSTSPELAAIHEQELSIAITDFDCRQRVNYRQRQNEVRLAIEERFIADHRTTLDALLAAAAQMG